MNGEGRASLTVCGTLVWCFMLRVTWVSVRCMERGRFDDFGMIVESVCIDAKRGLPFLVFEFE